MHMELKNHLQENKKLSDEGDHASATIYSDEAKKRVFDREYPAVQAYDKLRETMGPDDARMKLSEEHKEIVDELLRKGRITANTAAPASGRI